METNTEHTGETMPAINNSVSGLGYPGGRNAYSSNQGPDNFFGTPVGIGYAGGRNAYSDGRGPSGFFGSDLGVAANNIPVGYQFAGLSLGGMLLVGGLLALVIIKK